MITPELHLMAEGLNRMWDQLDTSCRLELPVYGGRHQPRRAAGKS